ncbi:MAG: PAS domain-containing protein [Proteobacteria bacterium]|nr:PAS domain-containing protein [Pseudomonadota bacterium]
MSEKLSYEELEKRVLELEKAESERKIIEEALQDNKRRLQTLIRVIPDLLWVKDQQGHYIYCNSRFESLFGAKEKEIVGKTDYDFLNKELADFLLKHDNEVMIKEKPLINELDVNFIIDGHREILETITTPIYHDDGQLAGVLGIGRDITEHKKAKDTLARRIDLERLISAISSEFIRLGPDEIDAAIYRALSAVGLFFGADRAYVYILHNDGKLADNTHEWCAEGISPQMENLRNVPIAEELPWFTEQIRKVDVLQVPNVSVLPLEARLKREIFDSQDIKSIIIIPMRLGDRLLGLVGFDTIQNYQDWAYEPQILRLVGETFTNAIERKRIEEEREDLQAKLSNALDMAHLGHWEYDIANDLFIFNDHFYKSFRTTARQVGRYTMSSAEYTSLFLHPDDISFIEQDYRKAQESSDTNISGRIEHRFISADKTIGYTNVRYHIIKDANGQPVRIYGVNHDITERKRAEIKLKESEEKLARSKKMESLGLLAGGVAHDLNNVLSGIVSYPELLLLDLPKNSKLRKPIETIQESGNKAVSIVQDLLTIARGVASTKEPLNLNYVIREYLTSPEFAKLKQFHPTVSIKTKLDADLLNISASLVHIRKVIMNLISNASEAIEGQGKVIVSTKNCYVDRPIRGYDDINTGEYVILSVYDDGSGILPEYLERIFEPFFTKKVMGRSGTGLGLAVVWNIVQDHEGYINVTSNEKGTIFDLYFPITRKELSTKVSSLPIEKYKGNGEIVLVVDDIQSQREISCKMLEKLGYKTKAVPCGEEAVSYLKENKVDLILLDMIMDPGINGRKTYERIVEIYPKQKAVIVSGYSMSLT